MKVNTGQWWNDTKGEKTEGLEKELIPMPFCAPQIPYALPLGY
jgi:hypothetical protein